MAALPLAEARRFVVWRYPLLTATTAARMLAGTAARAAAAIVAAGWLSAAAAVVAAAVAALVASPPAAAAPAVDAAVAHAAFTAYWLVLGVLSSIGLGSGLHTFVLYLGPHIVRIAAATLVHKTTAFTAAIDTYFAMPPTWDVAGIATAFSPGYAPGAFVPAAHATAATPHPTTASLLVAILVKVAPAAFLWGLGTALGELPPYFIALAASRVRGCRGGDDALAPASCALAARRCVCHFVCVVSRVPICCSRVPHWRSLMTPTKSCAR